MANQRPKHASRGTRSGDRRSSGHKRAEQIQLATYRISEAAHTAATLQDLYQQIHQVVGELMPAQNFYIALHDADVDAQTLTFPYWVDEYDPPAPTRPVGRGLTEYVLRTGLPLLADEAIHRNLQERGEADLIGAPSIQWLGVPLKIDDKTIGVLAIQTYTKGVRYDDASTRILEFVSRQVAMAIQRKRAEVALRESEARLARAQETAHLGSWEMTLTNLEDVNQNHLWWSDEVYRIFGYLPGEVAASNELFFKSVPPAEVPRIREAMHRSLRDGAAYFIRHGIIRPDGTERMVEERSTVLQDAAGRPVRMVGTVLDVTERQRLEEQLMQAQKMDAVGRLAGGVAHDFNNLLTAIIGSADLLRERLSPSHPERVEVDEIRAAALRAADLTRQLLAFSRRQILTPQVLHLNRVVVGMNKLLRRLIGADIEFRCVLSPDLGAVRADPGQIEQVIMNLVVNARDAMPRGGTLTIETVNVELDEAYATEHVPVARGHHVLLSVSDTGIGMDGRTQARLFEPFFTTKAQGQGTGLGLSTVYGIVKQSGGYIWVFSEPGRGSTFKIYLPQVDGATESAAAAVALPHAPDLPEGSETLLVVEDQAEVRRLTEKVLKSRGYTVLAAADGPEALRIAEQHSGPIDLLVTDVVMPQMSGREVGIQLTAARPRLKVLYLSGYADESMVHHGMLVPGLAFLQKPFTPEGLARKVRDLLDAPADHPQP